MVSAVGPWIASVSRGGGLVFFERGEVGEG